MQVDIAITNQKQTSPCRVNRPFRKSCDLLQSCDLAILARSQDNGPIDCCTALVGSFIRGAVKQSNGPTVLKKKKNSIFYVFHIDFRR